MNELNGMLKSNSTTNSTKNFNEINTLRSIASQSKIKTNYPQENM